MSLKSSPPLYTCVGCGNTEFGQTNGFAPENWVKISFDTSVVSLFKKEDYCPKCWGAMKSVIEMHYGKEESAQASENS